MGVSVECIRGEIELTVCLLRSDRFMTVAFCLFGGVRPREIELTVCLLRSDRFMTVAFCLPRFFQDRPSRRCDMMLCIVTAKLHARLSFGVETLVGRSLNRSKCK